MRKRGRSLSREISRSRENSSAPTSGGASSIGVPELPETETIARDLDREVAGARIVGVEVTKPDVLREVAPKEFAQRLIGALIVRCWRRAKLVIIDLDTSDRLVVQPRFTGALLLDTGDNLDDRELQYSTLRPRLGDER